MSTAVTPTGPVLYIEDDENDVYLMQRAFELLEIKNVLRPVVDGKDGLAYIAGNPPFADRVTNPPPSLILLDLSIPGKNGIDILQWIRSRPGLAVVPVVVLTSSNQQTDIHRSYLLGASGFFVKPGDPDALINIVGAIRECWLSEKPTRTEFTDIDAFRAPVLNPTETQITR